MLIFIISGTPLLVYNKHGSNLNVCRRCRHKFCYVRHPFNPIVLYVYVGIIVDSCGTCGLKSINYVLFNKLYLFRLKANIPEQLVRLGCPLSSPSAIDNKYINIVNALQWRQWPNPCIVYFGLLFSGEKFIKFITFALSLKTWK